jgi:hypothetical protein
MSKAKTKAETFPTKDELFDAGTKGLMTHLGIADPDSGSTTVTPKRQHPAH